ncbi:MAG: hypothetical protein AAF654_12995 [Myxococcota bacterium]
MPRCALLVVFLLLSASSAHAHCIKFKGQADAVARLFPTGEVEERGKSCYHVAPVQRDGLWGYIDLAGSVTFESEDGLLAFRMVVGAKDKGSIEKLRDFDYAKDTQFQGKEYLAVILVDPEGAFLDKPEGYPRMASRTVGCTGDMCSVEGIQLNSIKMIHGADDLAWMDIYHGGSRKVIGFRYYRNELQTTKDIAIGPLDDLRGCGIDSEVVDVSGKGATATLQLKDHCDVGVCPAECRSEGFKNGMSTRDRRVALF